MAPHIDSVANSGIPAVDKAAFYHLLQGGDLVFCSGKADISIAIERETQSPFSHVLMAWVPSWSNEWLTLEATINRGVHIGRLGDYIDNYNGELILARRALLTESMIQAEMNAGFALLDDQYNWQEEVTYAAHKLVKLFPIDHPDGRLYCSGLIQVISRATPFPIQDNGPIMTTPDGVWTDSTVTAVCVLQR